MSARVAILLCAAWLVVGCASTTETQRIDRSMIAGAIHDPAREWYTDRVEPEFPPHPPRFKPRPRVYVDRPPPTLRRFRAAERQRIAAVQPLVRQASLSHGIPTDVINGIIWVESRFHRRAVSRVKAQGLMQVMPRTGREVAQQLRRAYRPFDPAFNIDAGTYYFSRMVRRFDGNLRLALAAYNIGPGTVQRWLDRGQPLAARSERYIDDVFNAARAFRARGY
ncbi:MAG: lytic transglycosylase domain-containing protein [Myxococcales bacterium]|nr:lytic transglycosylase domain-containing protein [Myxococcales bacterium]